MAVRKPMVQLQMKHYTALSLNVVYTWQVKYVWMKPVIKFVESNVYRFLIQKELETSTWNLNPAALICLRVYY